MGLVDKYGSKIDKGSKVVYSTSGWYPKLCKGTVTKVIILSNAYSIVYIKSDDTHKTLVRDESNIIVI